MPTYRQCTECNEPKETCYDPCNPCSCNKITDVDCFNNLSVVEDMEYKDVFCLIDNAIGTILNNFNNITIPSDTLETALHSFFNNNPEFLTPFLTQYFNDNQDFLCQFLDQCYVPPVITTINMANGCCDESIIPTSTPSFGLKTDTTVIIDVLNKCGNSVITTDEPARVIIEDSLSNIVAEAVGTTQTPLDQWTNVTGVLSNHATGTIDSFTFNYGTFGGDHPVDVENLTIRTYVSCHTAESTNTNNFITDCFEPYSLLFVVTPDSPALAEIIGTNGNPTRDWELGQTFHMRYRFTLGRDITGVWETDNFAGLYGQQSGNSYTIKYANRSITESTAPTVHSFNSYPLGTDTNTVTVTFDVPIDCFGMILFFDNLDLGVGDVIINATPELGFTSSENIVGSPTSTTYLNGTIKDLIGTGNDDLVLAKLNGLSINSISFKILKDDRAVYFKDFKKCGCDGLI